MERVQKEKTLFRGKKSGDGDTRVEWRPPDVGCIVPACFLMYLLLIGNASALDEIDIILLPRDEKDAGVMLGEGVLDSSVWDKVEPFYTTPLCVPRGELRILKDLFFSLPDSVPTTPSALAPFLPWDNAAQERLFAEYPELVPFKPILSFENSAPGSFPGKIEFCFSQPFNSDTVRQFALFSVGQGHGLASAEGRVDFTDAYGRWYRRTVSIVPHAGYSVTFGNFGSDFRDRLFFGYFPVAHGVDTSLMDNWLYGTSRSWNGVFFCMEQERKKGEDRVSVTEKAFYHAGPGERIGFCEGMIAIDERVTFQSGFSYLETIDSTKRMVLKTGYYQCGITVTPGKNQLCELQSGFDLRCPTLVPFELTWSRSDDRSRLHVSLTGLPDGFYAPRSALVHYITSKTGMGDTVDGYTTAADVQFTHVQSAVFSWTPRITAIFVDDALRYLTTAIGVSGRTVPGYNYRAVYSWSPLFHINGPTVFRNEALLEESIPLCNVLRVIMINRCNSESDGYWRYTGTFSPQFEIGRVIRVAPLLVLSAAGSRSFEETAGIRQTLLFSEKTFSEINIEKQFPLSGSGNLSVQGRMSFLF
jgi:hypothetical protein